MYNQKITFYLIALIVSFFMLTGCSENGGGSGDKNTLSTSNLTGAILVLQPNDTDTQATSSRTYQFFAGGNCTYTFASLGLPAETVTMQWQVEGNILYINNGDRFSGIGSYRPQEWSFPKGLTPNAPAVAQFQALEVKSFTPGTTGTEGGPTGSTVGNSNLYSTAMAFSVGGNRGETLVHYFVFYANGTGLYLDKADSLPHEIEDIIWNASSDNGFVNIDYSDTKKGELHFLNTYASGELFSLKITGLASFPVTTTYTILEVGNLEDLLTDD